MSKDQDEIKLQFFKSLKLGTGKAYLLFKDNPGIDFSDLIIKGAVTNFAYDQQCEGSRAKYIYEFIKRSKQKKEIIKAVLRKLEYKKNDYWALDQLCDLAVLFFKAGYPEAKDALYNRFNKSNHQGYEFCGQDQLIELDGLKGLLVVAETIGKTIIEDNNWEDSWRVDSFQKKNKSIDVYLELKRASEKNNFIEAYYKSICENKINLSKRSKPIKFSYDTIKEKIDSDKFRAISTSRANDLTVEEVAKLARDFLNEKDKAKQERYLRFFAKRSYPFEYHHLLKIASSANPRKTRLVEYAADSLQYFEGADIRQLALRTLTTTKSPHTYLSLLVSNYQPGDCKLLIDIVNRSDNYDYIHSIVYGFISIYKTNHTKECKEPLEMIYNKMNCGLHRKDIIGILMENNVLSVTIQQELRYDSYDEIRKLFAKQLKSNK